VKACIERASLYDVKNMVEEYSQLYRSLIYEN
jgi:hypothetical protein